MAGQKFTASQNALNRAASAASSGPSGPSAADLHNTAINILTAKGAQGKDKKVSPDTFNRALNAYLKAGGTPNDFRTAYAGYANLAWSPTAYGYYRK